MTWPWPKDSPVERARRVARSYRSALEDLDPGLCAYLDAEMVSYGQRWVGETYLPYDEYDLLTADLVADYAHVAPKTVYEWKARGLPGIKTPDGWRFRFGDVRTWITRRG